MQLGIQVTQESDRRRTAYIDALHRQNTPDPGDAQAVIDYLALNGLSVSAFLIEQAAVRDFLARVEQFDLMKPAAREADAAIAKINEHRGGMFGPRINRANWPELDRQARPHGQFIEGFRDVGRSLADMMEEPKTAGLLERFAPRINEFRNGVFNA